MSHLLHMALMHKINVIDDESCDVSKRCKVIGISGSQIDPILLIGFVQATGHIVSLN